MVSQGPKDRGHGAVRADGPAGGSVPVPDAGQLEMAFQVLDGYRALVKVYVPNSNS